MILRMKYSSYRKIICFLLWVLLTMVPQTTSAESFTPILSNYTSFDYHAGLQNWSVTQDKDGIIHIGNNSGMLTFDGYHWTLTQLPGQLVARSLMADGSRIYVGSYQQFGYFERDINGQYQYTSLWNELKDYSPQNDEIWNIIKAPNGHIIFQAFYSWFEYDGKEVKAHLAKSISPLNIFRIGQKVYAQIIAGDLSLFEGNRFKPVVKRSDLGGSNVVSVLPYDEKHLLLVTEYSGLFLYDGKKPISFHTDIDTQLRTEQLNRAIMTHQGHIVIGTIHNGIYELSHEGRKNWHFNTSSMLHQNTVLGLYCDDSNNIWAALDAGIALIHTGAPYSLLSGSLGSVYDTYVTGQQLYIATNQSAHVLRDQQLLTIAGTQGQNWHLTRLDDYLMIGNNQGLQLINDDRSSPFPNTPSSGSTAMGDYTVNSEQSYLIEAGYSDIHLYEKREGRWIFNHGIEGFMAPVSQLEVDETGAVWLSNMNQGCYRLELSDDMRQVKKEEYITHLRKDADKSRIFVMKIRGRIVLSDLQQLYIADDNGDIKPFEALNRVAGPSIMSATTVDNNHFWLSSETGYSLIAYDNNSYHVIRHIPTSLFGLEYGGRHNRVRCFDGIAYFCLNGGVGRYDMKEGSFKSKLQHLLILQQAYYTDLENVRHIMPTSGDNIESGSNVTLCFSYPNYNHSPLTFVCHLKHGHSEITITSNDPEIHFSNLAYGTHEVTCEVKDSEGNIVAEAQYHFNHSKPLLLSWPMILLYILLLASLGYLYANWRTNRALEKQHKKAEERRIRQELELAKQQQIIEQQQKLLLEQQLQDKGRELATISMEALKDKDAMGNEEYWEVFRQNFDLIHKNFFRHLREAFPNLTANDLKFCAYLRLNLSSKEIVNLTGISIRGVEGARYRLRKKLGLKEGDDLASFLIDFHSNEHNS